MPIVVRASILLLTLLSLACPKQPSVPNINGWYAATLPRDPGKQIVRLLFVHIEQNGANVKITQACKPNTVMAVGQVLADGTLQTQKADTNGIATTYGVIGANGIQFTPVLNGTNSVDSPPQTPVDTVPVDFQPIKEPTCVGGEVPPQDIVYINSKRVTAEKQIASLAATNSIVSDPCADPNSAQYGSLCQNLAAQNGQGFPMGDSKRDIGPSSNCTIQATGVTCTTTPTTDTAVVDLADQIVFATNPLIFPGSVLQGEDFINGRFSSIPLPRGTGSFHVSGLFFNTPNATTQFQVNEVNEGNVADGLHALFQAQPDSVTTASISHQTFQITDESSLSLALGVNINYGASFANKLGIDKSSKHNFFLVKFTQGFYTVSYFDAPTYAPGSFFQPINGVYQDPGNQLLKGPPVYVSQVTYGRQLFLLIESDYDSLTIDNTMTAAYPARADGNDAVFATDLNLKYNTVMQNSKVTYLVIGGNASDAVKPLSADSTSMYDAVKDLITNQVSSSFSANNPGAPIAFTVNYLIGGAVAAVAYTTSYVAKNCTITPANTSTYSVHFPDGASIRTNFYALIDPPNQGSDTNGEGYFFNLTSPTPPIVLNQGLLSPLQVQQNVKGIPNDAAEHYVQFELGSSSCFGYNLDFFFTVDGVDIDRIGTNCGFFCTCGWPMNVVYRVNAARGSANVIVNNGAGIQHLNDTKATSGACN